MAQLNTSAYTTTGFSWSVSALGYAWNTVQYDQAYVTVNNGGTTSQPQYAPASGSNLFTPTVAYTGTLSPNTAYTVTGWVVPKGQAAVNVGTSSFTTLGPPIGVPSVSGTAQTGHAVQLSWSAVSGATSYDIYADGGSGSFIKGNGITGTSFLCPTTAEYVNYTFGVQARNANGYGSTGNTVVRTLDEKPPSFTSFYSTQALSNSITVVVTSCVDNSASTTPASSASGLWKCEFYINGGLNDTQAISGNVDCYRTFSAGVSQNTTYPIFARVYDNAGNMVQTATINVTTAPAVPNGTPTVTATIKTGLLADLSWTSVQYATSYDIYKNSGSGDVLVINSTGLSYSNIVIDLEYTNYTFKVVPKNASGTGGTGSVIARSKDETNPTYNAPLYATQRSNTQLTVILPAVYDPTPAKGVASGITRVEFYKDGALAVSQATSGNDVYYTYTGLNPNQSYSIMARIFDVQGNMLQTASVAISTTNRPVNFAWTVAKTSGVAFNLTATEWNNFTNRINSFRLYKGLSNYSFTTAASNGTFFAYMWNQARTAINDMTPPTAVPAVVASGGDVFAAGLNALRDSVNSIP